MSGFYVYCRNWAGFTDKFPFYEELNSLPDELLEERLHAKAVAWLRENRVKVRASVRVRRERKRLAKLMIAGLPPLTSGYHRRPHGDERFRTIRREKSALFHRVGLLAGWYNGDQLVSVPPLTSVLYLGWVSDAELARQLAASMVGCKKVPDCEAIRLRFGVRSADELGAGRAARIELEIEDLPKHANALAKLHWSVVSEFRRLVSKLEAVRSRNKQDDPQGASPATSRTANGRDGSADHATSSMHSSETRWLDKVVACVHEDARNPQKAGRYGAMIREWVDVVVRDPRPRAMPLREYYRKQLPHWTEEQIEAHIRMRNFADEAGAKRRGEESEVILHDPISITTHAGTPISKMYATLAAIHDASDHCAFPLDPWASKNWPRIDECSPEDFHELNLGVKYEILKGCVADLTEADEPGLRRMLDEVAADLEWHLGGDVSNAASVAEPTQLPPARPSVDFRSVYYYGANYSFTKMQAVIFRLLWEAFQNGTPDIGAETLLEAVDAKTSRLVDIFRDHPAWGTLIVDGKTKGSKRLADAPKS